MIDSSLKNANILIVDDQQANIDVLTGLLDAKGFTNYTTTKDSRQVIGLFEVFKPDLLLLDLSMPHLTGFQVMMQMKILIPASTYFPILVLTADITPESKQKALACGASDFLAKPFDLIEVDLRIKNLLKARYFHQQLENQNQILEEKAKERTQELEKRNIELTAAKEQAEESDKLKSEFLNQMSHEIRSPMNAVLSFTNILREEIIEKLTPDLLDYFDEIDSTGHRLIRTVDLILNVSEMQVSTYELSFREFDLLKEIIGKIINDNMKLIESKGLKFNFFSDLSKAIIVGDQYSIYQIFVNLIDNSIKYTKKGYISINVSKDEQGINVSIDDTGIGISEEFLKIMYHPFMQEDRGNSRRYDENGLGFSLVKKYCDLNRIALTVESKKDVGTKFTLFFTCPK
ncbi:MAG: ATP-binding protein [Ignavibacteriales bacterium]|nr:ATP-binding protein [Ignavibacteriales bacterium]